jgi:hypothetical protein
MGIRLLPTHLHLVTFTTYVFSDTCKINDEITKNLIQYKLLLYRILKSNSLLFICLMLHIVLTFG